MPPPPSPGMIECVLDAASATPGREVVPVRNALLARVVPWAGSARANARAVQGPADAACRERARSQAVPPPHPNRPSLRDLGPRIRRTGMASSPAGGPRPGRRAQRF